MKKYLKPPALCTSFSESGKKAKKRFDNIFSKSRRISIGALLAVVASAALCTSLVACRQSVTIGGADGPTAIYVSESSFNKKGIEDLVTAAVFERNSKGYVQGECQTEGHIILGTEKSTTGETVVYALIMYGNYGFQDGNFVKVSGSGVIPTRVTFEKNGSLIEYKEPLDGSMYTKSVKEIFPQKYHSRVLSIKDSDHEDCKKQEHAYARAYLDKIGRRATIGDYGDFEHTLLTDLGVSVEVSNSLLAYEKSPDLFIGKCPYWVGTQEFLENGERFLYRTAYDKEKERVIYTKSRMNPDNTLTEIDAAFYEIKTDTMRVHPHITNSTN